MEGTMIPIYNLPFLSNDPKYTDSINLNFTFIYIFAGWVDLIKEHVRRQVLFDLDKEIEQISNKYTTR